MAVDLLKLLSPKANYEDAVAAEGRNDKKAALAAYEAAVDAATPTSLGAHVGDGFDGPEAEYGRKAAYAVATDAQLRGQAALSALIAREKKGELIKPTDKDVQDTETFLGKAERYLNAATHDAQGRALPYPDALYWLAKAHIQMAQAQAIAPALQGVRVALGKNGPDLSNVPSLLSGFKAEVALDEARKQGLNSLPKDPHDGPSAVDGKTRGDALADGIRAQELTIISEITAGAVAALSPATNVGPLRTPDGKKVEGADLMQAVNAGEYARVMRLSRGPKLTTAEALRAALAAHGMTTDDWKKYFVGEWNAKKAFLEQAHPDMLTPRTKEALEKGDALIQATDASIR